MDFKVKLNDQYFDFEFQKKEIEVTNGLINSVIISLFTYKDNWINYYQGGSKEGDLYDLLTSKQTPENKIKIEHSIEKSLSELKKSKIITNVETKVEYVSSDNLKININIQAPDNQETNLELNYDNNNLEVDIHG